MSVGAAGLTGTEAARRLAEEGPNALHDMRRRGPLRLLIEVLRDPMFLLLLACGGLYFLLGDLQEAAMLTGAIVIVVGIAVFQQQRTERALEALRELTSPRALVLRDGVRRRIPARELVRGDRVILAEGDRVPADGRLVDGDALSVDEAVLTGESVPVTRAPGDSAGLAFGTLVVQGQGSMEVTATGMHTRIGQLGGALADVERPRTRLQRETDRVVRWVATGGLALCGLAALVHGLRGNGWLEGLLAGLTIAMSLLPEEFPVVLTVMLAFGGWRMARRQVLTRRLNALETLGSASVLCVDKTGTLTLNSMELVGIQADCRLAEQARDWAQSSAHRDVLEAAVLASDPGPVDPLEQALQAASGHAPAAADLRKRYPLRPELLAMTQVWPAERDDAYRVATKGAPETVAALCHLDPAATERVLAEVEALAARGWRILGVAEAEWSGPLPESPREFGFHWRGLVALRDPLRPTVPGAVTECRDAGIRVIMVTGDYPGTASAIAAEIGLANPREVLTGTEIEQLSDAALAAHLEHVNVCCRVSPNQKLRLVRALQQDGEVVAMTGDGVNDAPALGAADIGIAMGGRGTDVAREAADLVLSDDRFESIVAAVRMGRRMFDNLGRAVTYIIALHMPIAAIAISPMLLGWPLMFLPVHIMMLEMIIDPACSLAFESEPAEPDIMRRPPRPAHARLFNRRTVLWALEQGGGAVLAVAAVWLTGTLLGWPDGEVRGVVFGTTILTNIGLILSNSVHGFHLHGGNRVAWWVFAAAGSALLLVLSVPVLRDLFHFDAPGPAAVSLMLTASAALAGSLALLRHWRHGGRAPVVRHSAEHAAPR